MTTKKYFMKTKIQHKLVINVKNFPLPLDGSESWSKSSQSQRKELVMGTAKDNIKYKDGGQHSRQTMYFWVICTLVLAQSVLHEIKQHVASILYVLRCSGALGRTNNVLTVRPPHRPHSSFWKPIGQQAVNHKQWPCYICPIGSGWNHSAHVLATVYVKHK